MGCNASQTQVSSVLPSHVSSEEYGKHPSKHVKIGNRKKLQLSDIEEKKTTIKVFKDIPTLLDYDGSTIGKCKKPRTKIGLLPLRCNQCELAFNHVEH